MPDETRKMRQHLGEPHHRKVTHGEQRLQPLGFALWAADAGKADAAAGFPFERAHQSPGEIVSGGLARDDEDQRLTPAHIRSQDSSLPPRREGCGLAVPRASLVDELPNDSVLDDKASTGLRNADTPVT